ncbi:MAG: type II toxin-antitoxin system VapC family toxin [Thermoguttaceae bacterium]
MILIDTHVLIWLYGEHERISPKARQIIRATDVCNYSAISLWEIAMLYQKRRVNLGGSLKEYFLWLAEYRDLQMLPITFDIAERSGTLDMHGDPADRLIVATAIEHSLTLLTTDHLITDRHIVSTVW